MPRRPAPMLPAPAARLAGFALLAGLGVLEWRQMVDAVTLLRALLWVAAGCVAAVLLIGAARVGGRMRPVATVAAALGGLAAAVAVSGLDLDLLVRPSRWGELGDGIIAGTDALGGARLPYRGIDPWPGATLELSGALLVALAALIAFWPRGRRTGWPLGALMVLLILVVSPVAALSGQPQPALGVALAALTACFLFLERLAVRPGAGAVVLAVAALAVAVPLGAAADRDQPWFDYRNFAESLGPVEPIAFNWDHGYGAIRWPRDGRELFRVKTDAPAYWKAEALSDFDGERWRLARQRNPDGNDPLVDLPDAWRARSSWTHTAHITLRRLQTDTIVGPGTIVRVSDVSHGVDATWMPGGWLAGRELGRGDSYTVESHVPRPSGEQLAATNTEWDGLHPAELQLRLPFRGDALAGSPELPQPAQGFAPNYVGWALVEFRPFGLAGAPQAHYPVLDVTGDGRDALRRSSYERTWHLAQRLKRQSTSAFDYVLRVNAFLRSDSFRYTEIPKQPPEGVPPLEFFLHESREGYCQHFSGAMALLLRMGGVPARVATGFTPGGLRKQSQEWIVRDVDAHSWIEAWFDDLGWVTFDPTPAGTPARSQIAAVDTPGLADQGAGPAPDRDTGPATRRPEGPSRDTAAAGSTPAPAAASPVDGGGGAPWWLLAFVPVGLAAALLARLLGSRPAPGEELDTAILEVRRALARSGRALAPDATLAQLERRFGGSAYLRGLTSVRYAARPAPPTPRDRAEFRRQLAEGLGWQGVVRSWWAVPPGRFRLRRPPR